MFPEGASRERRSRLASVRRSAARAPRAAALLRPGPYRSRAGWSCWCRRSCCSWERARRRRCPAARCRRRSTARRRWRPRTSSRSASAIARPGARGIARRPTGSPSGCAPSGADVSIQHFRAPDANGRTVPMLNVLGVVSGPRTLPQRPRLHRGTRRSARRARARTTTAPAREPWSSSARTLVGSVTQTSLVFASVDGTTAESAGARELARHPPAGLRLSAGIALRAVGRPGCAARPAALGRGTSPARGRLAAHGRAGAARRGRPGRAPALARPAGRRRSSRPWCTATRLPLVGAGAAVVGIDGSRPGLSSAADTSATAARRPAAALRRPARARRHRDAARRAGLRHRAAAGQPRLDLPRLERSRAARMDARALPRRAADTARVRTDRRRGPRACSRCAPVHHGAARALARRPALRSACS